MDGASTSLWYRPTRELSSGKGYGLTKRGSARLVADRSIACPAIGQRSRSASPAAGPPMYVTWRRERLIVTRRTSDAAATPLEIPR